jgi:hypothetical protein
MEPCDGAHRAGRASAENDGFGGEQGARSFDLAAIAAGRARAKNQRPGGASRARFFVLAAIAAGRDTPENRVKSATAGTRPDP